MQVLAPSITGIHIENGTLHKYKTAEALIIKNIGRNFAAELSYNFFIQNSMDLERSFNVGCLYSYLKFCTKAYPCHQG